MAHHISTLVEAGEGATRWGNPFKLDSPRNAVHEARDILAECDSFRFDYLYGRPLKMHSRDGEIGEACERLFDRDAYQGAFKEAVQATLDVMEKEKGR